MLTTMILMIFDDDLNKRNRIHCFYMMALGNLGLNRETDALNWFDRILSLDTYHLGAKIHRAHTNFQRSVLPPP